MHRRLIRNSQRFAVVALAAAFCSSARAAFIDLTPTNGVNSSASVKLSDLVSGTITGITVGDKQFAGFSYSETGDMPLASDVYVLGLEDANGNFGITFQGAFLDLPGGGNSDAAIRYAVSVQAAALQQGFRISDAHLVLNGVGVGSPDSGFFVDETFAPDSAQTLHAFDSTFAGGTTSLSDSTTFSTPLATLHVTKDILAIASAASGQAARASVIDQSFSQSVPEPSTLAMLTVASLLPLRRKQKPSAV